MKDNRKFKIGFNDESAIVTHYFNNIDTPFEKPFKNEARRLLGDDDSKDTGINVSEEFGSYNMFPELYKVPFPAPENPKFTFIDLFAGIGTLYNSGNILYDPNSSETFIPMSLESSSPNSLLASFLKGFSNGVSILLK